MAGAEDRIIATGRVDGGGLVSRNLSLPADVLRLSLSHNAFAQAYLLANPGTTPGESVFDATCRIQPNDHFAIQPDLQYTINPHNSGRKAVAVGIRGEIGFRDPYRRSSCRA